MKRTIARKDWPDVLASADYKAWHEIVAGLITVPPPEGFFLMACWQEDMTALDTAAAWNANFELAFVARHPTIPT